MLKIEVKGYREAKALLDQLPNNMQKRMLEWTQGGFRQKTPA